jgi:hypothetical protein
MVSGSWARIPVNYTVHNADVLVGAGKQSLSCEWARPSRSSPARSQHLYARPEKAALDLELRTALVRLGNRSRRCRFELQRCGRCSRGNQEPAGRAAHGTWERQANQDVCRATPRPLRRSPRPSCFADHGREPVSNRRPSVCSLVDRQGARRELHATRSARTSLHRPVGVSRLRQGRSSIDRDTSPVRHGGIVEGHLKCQLSRVVEPLVAGDLLGSTLRSR